MLKIRYRDIIKINLIITAQIIKITSKKMIKKEVVKLLI